MIIELKTMHPKKADVWIIELAGSKLPDGQDGLLINSNLAYLKALLMSRRKVGQTKTKVGAQITASRETGFMELTPILAQSPTEGQGEGWGHEGKLQSLNQRLTAIGPFYNQPPGSRDCYCHG